MSSICNGCHFLNDFLGWFNVILISRPLNSDSILEIRCIHPRNLSVCLIFGLVHLQLKSSELTRWLYKNRYHLLHRLSIHNLYFVSQIIQRKFYYCQGKWESKMNFTVKCIKKIESYWVPAEQHSKLTPWQVSDPVTPWQVSESSLCRYDLCQ